MRIAVENSTWNNIGDAFYQISLMNALTQALPAAEIFPFDGPGYRAFRPRSHEPRMADLRNHVDADHIVLSGPIVDENFIAHYGGVIESVLSRGGSYSLLSIHAWRNRDLGPVLEFFERFPPLAIHTRDAPSFGRVGHIAECRNDGVCFAYFVSKVPQVPRYAFDEPRVAVSFYRGPEPALLLDSPDAADIWDKGLKLKESSGSNWKLWRHLEHRRSHPRQLAEYTIVRPVHSFYPLPHLLFSKPESYISYNPQNMLGLYSSVEAVITDRIHAGVAGLSFGKPAFVQELDERGAIYSKLPFEKRGGFMLPNDALIDEEYAKILGWLNGPFSKAIGLG